jgi:energy-coupling factor transporter ATP-binding protein EcfA2
MLIGIIGLKGSGKSTLSDILERIYSFEIDSFAKPVKDIASIIFGWERNMLEGLTKESREWRERKDLFWSEIIGKDFTPRMALQMIGTDFGRNMIGNNVWVESLKFRSKGKRIVISDVRYPNEAESIKKGGGILIKIERGEKPEYLKKIQENKISNLEDLEKFIKENFPQIHSSDYSLSLIKYDFLIKNDLDKRFLEEQLEEIFKRLI